VDLEADRLRRLCSGVEEALRSLPVHFRSTTNIEGIQATDLFALNTLLATTIETRVVETLNRTRSVWDPAGEWNTYSFERQAQTFPDVRLVSRRGSEIDIALGIELKGWYLPAKEAMPSLRLTVNPAACAPHDLVAVVPWYLSNVLSGVPTVLEPWVHGARAAAEHRNHWWTEVRVTTTDPAIVHPSQPVRPYPNKADEVADKPVADRRELRSVGANRDHGRLSPCVARYLRCRDSGRSLDQVLQNLFRTGRPEEDRQMAGTANATGALHREERGG